MYRNNTARILSFQSLGVGLGLSLEEASPEIKPGEPSSTF